MIWFKKKRHPEYQLLKFDSFMNWGSQTTLDIVGKSDSQSPVNRKNVPGEKANRKTVPGEKANRKIVPGEKGEVLPYTDSEEDSKGSASSSMQKSWGTLKGARKIDYVNKESGNEEPKNRLNLLALKVENPDEGESQNSSSPPRSWGGTNGA